MLMIQGVASPEQTFFPAYPAGSLERTILERMAAGQDTYRFKSPDELRFELSLRRAIVNAAEELSRSGLNFRVFRKSFCNTAYWVRHPDGGFSVKPGVSPADAILDIYKNGHKYGTECATAMQIVYYRALLDVFCKDYFDRNFRDIYLMNWHRLSPEISRTGRLYPVKDFLPGDRLYFANPDVDPATPYWQGENVIDMGDDTYYGHGIGRRTGKEIIASLNQNRVPGATRTAYLMDDAGRPDFALLYRLASR